MPVDNTPILGATPYTQLALTPPGACKVSHLAGSLH